MTPHPFRPGNRVCCVDTRPHCHWLRLYAICTVDCVSEDGRRVGLSTGPARMWDADQFVPATEEPDPGRRAYLDGSPGQPPPVYDDVPDLGA